MNDERLPDFPSSHPKAGLAVAIFNVKYSPNLGDGIIAECIEAALQGNEQPLRTISLDLAGRTSYGEGMRHRHAILAGLQAIAPPMRRMIAGAVLRPIVELRLRPAWQRALHEADAAIIGGGHLFQDADLNFPIKLHAAMRAVRDAGIPCAILSVGVSDNWSNEAAKLFGEAFGGNSVADVSVRDEESQRHWKRQMESRGAAAARLCRDPGLLAREVYPAIQARPGQAPRVGLGVTSSVVLRHHGAKGRIDHDEFWSQLASELSLRGYDVVCFTNGADEDENYLDHVFPKLQSGLARAAIGRAARPTIPRELAALIPQFDLVIAHRLHSSILAYSYGKPHVGLSWDPKVAHFFRSVGRDEFVLPANATVSAVLECADAAIRVGIDERAITRVVGETREGIRRTIDRLLPHVSKREQLHA